MYNYISKSNLVTYDRDVDYFLRVLCTFTTKSINRYDRIVCGKLISEDRELFFCDIRNLFRDIYFETYVLEIRKYILKNPIEMLPQARMVFLGDVLMIGINEFSEFSRLLNTSSKEACCFCGVKPSYLS
ncbi:fatty acyl-CoA reductase wat-like isoform X1 [Vespula maculifrons]|uniref:Fatty acyl-CoA reductase wat-like isoform X1 n=1 Tax=Vespula maculifrons TaxID=7453 RepID=A0ABD2CVV5_VESMC